MIIYVVQAGDTLASIAAQFGVTIERLQTDNELPNPDDLVVGQSIVVRIPEVEHMVEPGETLYSIAAEYDVTPTKILQNNPWLAAQSGLMPGQEVVIRFEGEEPRYPAKINAYAYPFIDRDTLAKTLPFLTELSLFTYGFTPEGELIPIDDEELIAQAREAGVGPVMVLAPMTASLSFDSQVAQAMFNNPQGQAALIENIAATMLEKGYVALDIDFEFIPPEDKESFIAFIANVHARLSPLGLYTYVALAPKTSGEMTGLLYEAHDYEAIGAIADMVLLMTYEWGYAFSSPMPTAPINSVRRVLDYGVSVIPREKILMGIPNYAYDWPLPYVQGVTQAESLSNQEAIWRASYYNSVIEFDELSQCPYFYYTDSAGVEHVVWFDDARSMDAKYRLISEYNLAGAGIWQIMNFFPGMVMVINQLMDVDKNAL